MDRITAITTGIFLSFIILISVQTFRTPTHVEYSMSNLEMVRR